MIFRSRSFCNNFSGSIPATVILKMLVPLLIFSAKHAADVEQTFRELFAAGQHGA